MTEARCPAMSRRLRAVGGKSLETLEALNNDKATMETQLAMQVWWALGLLP